MFLGSYIPQIFLKTRNIGPQDQRTLEEGKGAYVPRVLYSADFFKNAEYRPPGPKVPRNIGYPPPTPALFPFIFIILPFLSYTNNIIITVYISKITCISILHNRGLQVSVGGPDRLWPGLDIALLDRSFPLHCQGICVA